MYVRWTVSQLICMCSKSVLISSHHCWAGDQACAPCYLRAHAVFCHAKLLRGARYLIESLHGIAFHLVGWGVLLDSAWVPGWCMRILLTSGMCGRCSTVYYTLCGHTCSSDPAVCTCSISWILGRVLLTKYLESDQRSIIAPNAMSDGSTLWPKVPCL